VARRKRKNTSSSSVKIIKRYGNRKLYDTQQSHYVTLEEISRMVRKGEDIRVVDNKTQNDLTSVTLAQIMLEEEKNQKNAYPLSLLKNLIQQSGESLTEWVQKGKDSISFMTTEGIEHLHRIIEKGHETTEEGTQLIREWISSQQKALEQAQKRIDERIKYFFHHLTGLDDLEKQIQELENKISHMETESTQDKR
jgi:polyhydroxyalkanoate synthesis repressor PhaR